MILGETTPRRIQAAGGIYRFKGQITTPDILTVHLEFDRCPVVWRHRIWGAAEYSPEVNNGIFFYGDKATVFATDSRWTIVPRDGKREEVEAGKGASLGVRHMADFLRSVRTRTPPACLPEDAFRSTATVQLGMISYRSKSTVVWDAERETIPDNPRAAELLMRPYRPPWKHPYSGA
jgi:predicted dehydrogenase